MSRIRFYLDEHLGRSVADGLKRRGMDVLTTVDAEMRSASDERQLALASARDSVLVTKDDDFLKLHAGGVQHAGIVVCTSTSDNQRRRPGFGAYIQRPGQRNGEPHRVSITRKSKTD